MPMNQKRKGRKERTSIDGPAQDADQCELVLTRVRKKREIVFAGLFLNKSVISRKTVPLQRVPYAHSRRDKCRLLLAWSHDCLHVCQVSLRD